MPHKDPQRAREYHAEYRANHRAEAAERTRLWRLANPGALKAWRASNPERAKEHERRNRTKNADKIRARNADWRARTNYYSKNNRKRQAQMLKDWLKSYGLTVDQYDQMVRAQDGRCAICGREGPGRKGATRLYVDHCHANHHVRRLLCFRCNTMIGNAQDSPDLLRRAAAYLEAACDPGGGSVCRRERGLCKPPRRRSLGD